MPAYKVEINGEYVKVHAKNEGQLSFAVAALKSGLQGNNNKIKEVHNGTSNDEQVESVDTETIRRPYLF